MDLTIYSSFKTVAESYIIDLEGRTHNELFSTNFTSLLKRHVYPFIGQTPISEVTKAQLIAAINNLKRNGGSISGVYNLVDNLKRLFRYAQVNYLLIENPCQGIKVPYPWRFQCRHFSDQEVAQLLFGFSKCELPELFKFSFVSGLPINISGALTHSSLDFETGICHITQIVEFKRCRHTLSDTAPASSPRSFSLPKDCINLLSSLPRKNSDLLFPSVRGKLITQTDIQSCLMRIQYYSGISDFTTHQIVENYIFECLNAGVDIVSLEEYYGYSRGYILKTYGWVNPELTQGNILPGNQSWRLQ